MRSISKRIYTVVLDLDATANAAGQATIIKQQIKKLIKNYAQLNTISIKLTEQLASEKKKIGKKPAIE